MENYYSTRKNVFEKNPEYLRLITSPSLSLAEKRGLIEEAFDKKAEDYIVSFFGD